MAPMVRYSWAKTDRWHAFLAWRYGAVCGASIDQATGSASYQPLRTLCCDRCWDALFGPFPV